MVGLKVFLLGQVALQSGDTVSGNSAAATVPFDTAVGGIFNGCCGGSRVTLTNSTVSGNSASTPSDAFGGILNSAPGSVLTLTNSTVSGNGATYVGGGLYNSEGTTTLSAVTLVANHAGMAGGGLYASATLGGNATATTRLARTIAAGNLVGAASQDCATFTTT